MKKIFKIVSLLTVFFLCGTVRNISDSFQHYRIGIVVKDSTSLNANYEKPIYRQLKIAGHDVKCISYTRLTGTTWNGIENFSALDLVVIPNFVTVPTIDTSMVGGIGDVPVVCLEDSLLDDLGFVSNSEPIIFIGDYGNFRIIQTKFDGVGWKTKLTLGNRKPYGLSLDCTAPYAPDSTNVFFSSYVGGIDTLFKSTWAGAYTKYGTIGSGTGQFNSPRQVHVYDASSATYNMLVGDDGNSRLVDTKFGNSGSWRNVTQGNAVYGAYKTTNCYFYYTKTKLYRGTSTASAPTDSMTISNTGKHIFANDLYVFVIEGAYPYKIYKISTASFTKLDSLTSSKIGTPFSVWYDYRTTFLYWLDGAGCELKRAKFDGSADGAEIDSCFGVGTGVNQLSITSYGGIAGYIPSPFSSLTDDSIKVRIKTDSITSVYDLTNLRKVYTSNDSIAGMDTVAFSPGNVLCKSKDNSLATVVIDTLNSKKRIAFGLYDVSKLTNIHEGGWTLFNRCVGRLVEAEKDSIFSIGRLVRIGTAWPYIFSSASLYSPDSAYKNLFETNMHRVKLIPDAYGDSSQFRLCQWSSTSSFYNWETLQLYQFNTLASVPDTLKAQSIIHNIPLYDLNFYLDPASMTNLEGINISSITVTGSHSILTDAGLSNGDTVNIYTNKTYPFTGISSATGDYTAFRVADAAVSGYQALLKVDIGTNKYALNINLTKFWALLGLGFDTSLMDFSCLSSDYWNLDKAILVWLLEKDMLFPPSAVTCTPLSTSSIKISWTDNSSDELGFVVYLKSGGNYVGADKHMSKVAAGVTSDTLYNFWGPNSQWYFDVANWKAGTDTVQSGTPGSCYTLAAAPPKPIVYALSDTSISILLNGYKHYDLFNDTTLATNPAWVRILGSWNVEKAYKRLRTWATTNTISTKYDSTNKDVEIRTMFHFNDSLRLNSQNIKFYFISTNNAGTQHGYYIYADSSIFQVRKQTTNVDVDTLITSTWTGDYKWHTLRVTNDYIQYPTVKTIKWGVFLDGVLKGTFTDTTYQTIGYLVLKGSHRRMWWDNIWIKNYPYPAANGSATTYAIQDSVANKYLSATGTWGASAVWQTYAAWDSTNGVTAVTTASSVKNIKIKAKSN